MTAEPAAGAPFLSLRSLGKRFAEVVAVDDINLEIGEGEFFTIVGPSGSGKSTLIRILAGLEQPGSGSVWLKGKDITGLPANRRPTCMVFQSLALFTHRTVGQNIEFSQKMKGVASEVRREHAMKMMDVVRLPASYYARPVTQCSGGEKQRVALARALASDPEILFFDEPLSAIDYRLRKILEVEMKDLHRRTGKTFIYITHSLEEAMVMSDRIAIMSEGRIVQAGTPDDIYRRPANRFVAEFMGEVNIFDAKQGSIAGLPVVAADGGVAGFPDGYLVLRPEYLRHLRDGERADFQLRAMVENNYMLGSRTQFHLSAGDYTLVAELPAVTAGSLAPGNEYEWGFDAVDIVRVSD